MASVSRVMSRNELVSRGVGLDGVLSMFGDFSVSTFESLVLEEGEAFWEAFIPVFLVAEVGGGEDGLLPGLMAGYGSARETLAAPDERREAFGILVIEVVDCCFLYCFVKSKSSKQC